MARPRPSPVAPPPTSPSATDEQLMAAYVGGNDTAFRELFRRYAPVLLKIAVRSIPIDDALDVVQHTFLNLHASRLRFREGARFRPWILTVGLNLLRSYFRGLTRRREVPLDRHGAGPASRAAGPDAAALDTEIRAAVAALPLGQRAVIELHWFHGLSFREVAEVLGATRSAVKVRAHRGYRKLRTLLAEDGDARQALAA